MSATTLPAVLAQASHVAVARLTVLWPDGSIRRTFDLSERIITSATVTAERRRDVRRSASLQLVNRDGSLSPALADDLFAQGSPVLIERGALVDGEPSYIPLLTGFVTFCTADMNGTIDMTAESYMSALQQDAGTGLMLPAGTFLTDALYMLWNPALPSITWVIEPGAESRALGADIPVLATDSRLDIGLQITRDLGCQAFDDRSGRLIVRLRPDPTTQATTRVMTEPLSLSRTIGNPPLNGQGVLVSGAGEPFYVLVEVDDPTSPIYKGRIGLRMAPTITSDVIPDPTTARATALTWLAARAIAQDSLSATELPIHLDLDEGDIVERVETVSGTSGRFVIDSITYPVGPGTISTTETRVLPIFLEDAVP